MYCEKCGYNNPAEIKFCRNCEIELQPKQQDTEDFSALVKLKYASFGTRFLALFLDILAIIALVILMLFAIGMLVLITGNDDLLHNDEALVYFYWVIIALSAAYFITLESGNQGATPGKRWLKIKVIFKNDKPQSIARATGRFFAGLISCFFLPASILLQLFSKKKQTLHDAVAGTFVVRTNDSNKISIMATLLVLLMTLMLPLLALTATAGKSYIAHYLQGVQLNKGLQTGLRAAQAVARFYQINGRVPVAIEDTGENFIRSRYVSKIMINQQNGEITLEFNENLQRDIRSKHLLFKPFITSDQHISWKCSSPDIEYRYLPETCKE